MNIDTYIKEIEKSAEKIGISPGHLCRIATNNSRYFKNLVRASKRLKDERRKIRSVAKSRT